MAITSELQRIAALLGTGSAATLYTVQAASRLLSPVLYVNTIGVADTAIVQKTCAGITQAGSAGVTAIAIKQVAKRALAVDDDQQIELAGMEAGDILTVTGLATTLFELWGVLDK